jgi:hypothetical protein
MSGPGRDSRKVVWVLLRRFNYAIRTWIPCVVRERDGSAVTLRLTAAVVLLASAYVLTGCGSGEPQGPVRVVDDMVSYPHQKVGDVITDGAIQLTVPRGVGTPVIDAIHDLDTSSGLQFLGALVAGRHRRWGHNQMVDGYPPTQKGFGPTRPAVGAGIPPGQIGAELLLGYKVVAPGYQSRPHVEIDYHIGTTDYRLIARVGVVNCPKRMGFDRCTARFQRENPWW